MPTSWTASKRYKKHSLPIFKCRKKNLNTKEISRAAEQQSEGERQSEKNGSACLTMYGYHKAQSFLTDLPKWLQDYFAWCLGQKTNWSWSMAGTLFSSIGMFQDQEQRYWEIPWPYRLALSSGTMFFQSHVWNGWANKRINYDDKVRFGGESIYVSTHERMVPIK